MSWWDCQPNLREMPDLRVTRFLSGPYGGGLGDTHKWLEVVWPTQSVEEALQRKIKERRELV